MGFDPSTFANWSFPIPGKPKIQIDEWKQSLEVRGTINAISDGDFDLISDACLTEDKIFVFGSNLAGRHGKGAALHAKKYCGAIQGQGEGLQGRSYAIPTKDWKIKILPLVLIKVHVLKFREFAINRSDLMFEVTPIGCGLAGYSPAEIAPFFKGCPRNVELPSVFIKVLNG